MPEEKSDIIGLGKCLHDGIVETLRSDVAANTLAFVIHSPFHWHFHNLSADTRFEVIAEEVQSIEAPDWDAFISEIGTDEEHIVISAELDIENPFHVLQLGIYSYPNSNWRDIEIRAARFRFLIGEQELTLEEFRQFGDAYWDHWKSKNAAPQEEKKEK